jgi:hypothetical protein
MPSLQDALQSAIQKQTHNALHNTIAEWSDDEQKPTPQPQPQEKQTMTAQAFTVTNNVSRATFDFVRDNPGLHHNEIAERLIAKGFKKTSVTALLSQLRRSGQIARLADSTYHAAAKEYEPIKQLYKRPQLQKQAAKKVVAKKIAKPEAKSAGIAALQPVHTPVPAPAQVVSNDVEYILSTLPIKQARSLYDELHKIFGDHK